MKLNNLIDHTLLKPDASKADIHQLCDEAIENGFYAVCIPPYWVREVRAKLRGSNVKIATVVGFPLGYSHTPAKIEECKRAIDEGANEVDLVINIIALKENDINYLRNELTSATTMIHLRGGKLKVILETSLLNEEEIIKACKLCTDMEVDYVKTSTGFNGGATEDVIKLLRKNLPKSVKIKASGGIDTRDKAIAMVNAGADRLGCSKSLQIINKQ
jgi:deoxyribose-phosphate aldolase